MQIQISWLLQKPTDLDLHCLQRQGISWFSRTSVRDYAIHQPSKIRTYPICKGRAYLGSAGPVLEIMQHIVQLRKDNNHRFGTWTFPEKFCKILFRSPCIFSACDFCCWVLFWRPFMFASFPWGTDAVKTWSPVWTKYSCVSDKESRGFHLGQKFLPYQPYPTQG